MPNRPALALIAAICLACWASPGTAQPYYGCDEDCVSAVLMGGKVKGVDFGGFVLQGTARMKVRIENNSQRVLTQITLDTWSISSEILKTYADLARFGIDFKPPEPSAKAWRHHRLALKPPLPAGHSRVVDLVVKNSQDSIRLKVAKAEFAPSLVFNGSPVATAGNIWMRQGNPWLSADDFAKAFGGTASWDPRHRRGTIRALGQTAELDAGRSLAKVGSGGVLLEAAPAFSGGTLFLRPGKLTTTLGGQYSYDQRRKLVHLIGPTPAPSPTPADSPSQEEPEAEPTE